MCEAPMTLDVSGGMAVLEDNSSGVAIKIQSIDWELNIYFHPQEINNLKRITETSWIDGSIKAGRSARSDVFWSCDEGSVSILIGHDDQTWDFGVFIPQSEFIKILHEFQRNT
jgi:hypothetical protein